MVVEGKITLGKIFAVYNAYQLGVPCIGFRTKFQEVLVKTELLHTWTGTNKSIINIKQENSEKGVAQKSLYLYKCWEISVF